VAVAVLLVDDVDELRTLVRRALGVRGGFDVVGEAADGRTAVEAAERLQPDVVVLDLGLPDLAGRDVLSMLRSVAPDTRVVVFTGGDTADKKVMRTEVEGFVLKGETVQYLVDLLHDLSRPGPRSAVFRVSDRADEIAAARRFVSHHGHTWGYDEVLDDALIVVSELVTNAIMHARSACDLRLKDADQILRIEVIDGGRGSPELQRPNPSAEHGRGLLLVSAMCEAWGVDTLDDGRKMVWAEVKNAEACA
jgi:CheY-like chemotaxis protein/anti-sigma regulatory factor (Ser/Thr protein kinase)